MAEAQENRTEEHMLQGRPVVWRGDLQLRFRHVPIQLHILSGNRALAERCFPQEELEVLQMSRTIRVCGLRMDEITRKTRKYVEHAILIGMAEADEEKGFLDELRRAQILKNNFMEYFYCKRSVGFLRLFDKDDDQYELHVFPHCAFSSEYLMRLVPEDWPRLQHSAYLLFFLTKKSSREPSPTTWLGDQLPNESQNRLEDPDGPNPNSEQQSQASRQHQEHDYSHFSFSETQPQEHDYSHFSFSETQPQEHDYSYFSFSER
ncbi:hypothetical protein JTE90_020735 [Oedothorax gibbosus]|uniref:SPOC domain-containing protein n=1 Tax=Oedothorax gibbosus TaxID=931172 RepID=A0AAV6V6L0_9ARAC|nr:hypothetical protein JTE90_020735 [Oedothorax gibbosus]